MKGYVGLACGYSKAKGQRATWEDVIFKYPEEKAKINDWVNLKLSEECNLYWCPVIFSAPKRQKVNAIGSTVLYADLDEVDPSKLDKDIQPSVAWRSSMNRYQALWILDRFTGSLELENLNKRLSYFTGADKSGWDLTQVLRIPDTKNYQYSPVVQGQLLWENFTEKFPVEGFKKFLPEVQNDTNIADSETIFELIKKYRKQIPYEIRTLLEYPPDKVKEGKRSEILFKIESSLVEAKIPMEDIFLIVQNSNWNKYRGRKDEKERLIKEINLAYSMHQKGNINFEDDCNLPHDNLFMKKDEDDGSFNFELLEDLLGKPRVKSGWAVKGFWLKGSNGIVAGEPKTFKSTITLDLAISIASGKPFLDRYPVEETGPVIIVQNENAEWIIQDRLERMMVGKSLVGEISGNFPNFKIQWPPQLPIHFLNNQGFDFGIEEHREVFEDYVKKVKPVMIIFDPLYLMFEGDINSAQEVQPVLKWLTTIKNRYRTSIIIVHHFRKGESHRSGQRMLGSVTFHGWTESSIFLSAKPIEVSNLTDQLTIEEENKPAEVEIEVDREFRAEGPKPKIYLKVDMGDEDDCKYNVEVHNLPYAKYMKDNIDEEGNQTTEVKIKGGIIREIKKPVVQNPQSDYMKVLTRIETLVSLIPLTEVSLEDLNRGVTNAKEKITSKDLVTFCGEADIEKFEPIIKNSKTVGVKLLNL